MLKSSRTEEEVRVKRLKKKKAADKEVTGKMVES